MTMNVHDNNNVDYIPTRQVARCLVFVNTSYTLLMHEAHLGNDAYLYIHKQALLMVARRSCYTNSSQKEHTNNTMKLTAIGVDSNDDDTHANRNLITT
jgi:hypothetical protein